MGYRHTQAGRVIITGIGIAAVVALFYSWNTPQSYPVMLGVLISLIVVLGLFNSLAVELKGSKLTCSFGLGIIHKTFDLSDIHNVRIVRNPWYAGWGIRWMPGRYVLWSVSGFRAVELTLKDGSRFRIGTDEPEALVDAIRLHNTMYN